MPPSALDFTLVMHCGSVRATKVLVILAPNAARSADLKSLLVDQPHLDIGVGRGGRDAQTQVGDLLGVFIDNALHRRRAIDAAAADHGDADRMIEAADAARRRADAQIGAES